MVAVTAALIIPKLIDLNRYKGLITSEIEKAMGGKVTLGHLSWGVSNGIWLEAGNHHYFTIDLIFDEEKLYDYTSPGTAWDTWNYVEAYDYDNQAGLIGNAWPSWMSDKFDNPNLGYTDPASGPIYRWGNVKDGDFYGFYRLASGPTGPVSKGVWDVQDLK